MNTVVVINEFPWNNWDIQMIIMIQSRDHEMSSDIGPQNTFGVFLKTVSALKRSTVFTDSI